jgi:hypothetical protein
MRSWKITENDSRPAHSEPRYGDLLPSGVDRFACKVGIDTLEHALQKLRPCCPWSATSSLVS